MKKYWNRYIAGLFFIALGMYAFFESSDIPETFLYGSLGVAFTIMGFVGQHPDHPTQASQFYFVGSYLYGRPLVPICAYHP